MVPGYDTVWYCAGAAFRVHKFVLAAFSEHMKVIYITVYPYNCIFNHNKWYLSIYVYI